MVLGCLTIGIALPEMADHIPHLEIIAVAGYLKPQVSREVGAVLV